MENQMSQLKAHFSLHEISWRVLNVFEHQNKKKAIITPYVSARAIQDRLDDVFGIDSWQVSYERWSEKAVKCRLSVFINGKWIYKEDGSEETDFNSVKGGFSSSFKRAAVLFGIGRYLYNVENEIVDLNTSKKTSDDIYIKTQAGAYYFTPPKQLKLKYDKQDFFNRTNTNVNPKTIHSLIDEITQIATSLKIKGKEIILAYNFNNEAQARTFEDTTIGGLERILTSLRLTAEAKSITNANEKQLCRWLSAQAGDKIESFKEWLIKERNEHIVALIATLKNQQSA